jgi:hypothetical protein
MAYFFPKTKPGKWSVIFIAAFFLGFFAMQLLVASGETGGQGFPGNLLLFIPGVISGICGLVSLIVGFFALFQEKERSILNIVIIFFGLVILFLILSEIITPH